MHMYIRSETTFGEKEILVAITYLLFYYFTIWSFQMHALWLEQGML